MRSLKLALLATAATAAISSAAFAADLVVDTPPMAPVVDNSYSWDGAYIGAFLSGQTNPNAFGLGADFGVNALMDNFVIGGELEATASTGGRFSGQGTVHGGALLGDSAMIYAFSGIGDRTSTSWYVPLGAGIEFRASENVGIKAEAQYNFDLTAGAQNSAVAKVGLNWHF